MLKLDNITKDYVIGKNATHALKGVNMEFRKSEFVAILGPSGCGKTTLLNIIGGLDRYTDGDMYVNGRSTKAFEDYDWDKYRNNSVGFIFQNYNLIMHQTVLANVELALTLIGIGKAERRRRAVEALESVGLGDQINKKPNQLSGGQMQRVAIARAIINDPEILLADEPTGALDSESSVQVMDILKGLSAQRLVVMVTHNDELAEKYADRIIRVKDGLVVDDTAPYSSDIAVSEVKTKEKNILKRIKNYFKHDKAERKTSMSYGSALRLSANNLLTKKMRTALTSFAGSIGIIGIAIVLSLSAGFSTWIKQTEESSLAAYPIAIEHTSMNLQNAMGLLMGNMDGETNANPGDKVYVGSALSGIMSGNNDLLGNLIAENDVAGFKRYLDAGNWNEDWGAVKYSYDIVMDIYSDRNNDKGYDILFPFDTAMKELSIGGINIGSLLEENFKQFTDQMNIWNELIYSQNLLDQQYELVGNGSHWPTNYDEMVIILDKNSSIVDFYLFALGLLSPEDMDDFIGLGDSSFDAANMSFTFEDILSMTYRVMGGYDYYYPNPQQSGAWLKKEYTDFKKDKQYVEDNSIELKVVGIVRPKEGVKNGVLSGLAGYSPKLKEELIRRAEDSDIVKAQMLSNYDLTTGKPLAGATNEAKEESRQEVLEKLGLADLNNPSGIYIYANSFDSKDAIEAMIDGYNAKHPDSKITTTDTLGMMMGFIDSLSSTVTYVLIGFSSISLIVSSIMIGIITYISVLERTKEIGILRSIGARKKDISRVFNAETFMIGLISGLIGVIVTCILSLPLNAIFKALLGIGGLFKLVWWELLVLICISVGLTLLSGYIPARMAAKKDPVTALRSE